MDGLGIRYGEDLVALHDIQADTRHPGVGLVVDEQVLAVVLAVGGGQVRVVAIAVGVPGALPQDALALVGQAPTGGRVDIEHRDTHQLAHRWNAQHPHFALVAATPEAVVVVQLTGLHMDFRLGILGRRGKGFTREHRAAKGRSPGQYCPGHRPRTEETAPGQAVMVVVCIVHGSLLQGLGFICTTGICTGAALLRFLRLLISGGHLFSLCQVIWQSRQ